MCDRRKEVQTEIPSILWPSLVKILFIEVEELTNKLVETHEKKLIILSKKQDRPLLSTYSNVKILTDDIKLPEFVLSTLTMGPKSPALQAFNKNDILTEVDTLLEFLEPKIIRDDSGQNVTEATKNLIEVEALKYNRLMENKKIDSNILKT